MYTKIVGVTFEERQEIIKDLLVTDTELILEPEPENKFDENAVKVMKGDKHLGYLNRDLAEQVSTAIGSGLKFKATIEQITGGESGQSLGINIKIERLEQ